MDFNIAFYIDVSILVLLAATVFLAFRLSLSLRNFKESRFEMEGLMNRLSGNIDKAQNAMTGMQNTARKAGDELDEVISDAKRLRDELKLMNEVGDNLATRLENIAERNREMAGRAETTLANAPIRVERDMPRSAEDDLEAELNRSFGIHDRDFEEEYDDDIPLDDETGGFQSQAERELFEALQTSKIRQRGRA